MRVVIAEDGVLLREGLVQLLAARGFEVVGSCDTAERLLLLVRSYSPDVVIVDIRLPPTHSDEGLRAALEIRAHHPSVGVLVLSQYVELGLAMKLLADSAEGVGYLLKNRINDVKDFLAAVRRVAAGGSAIDPTIVSTLLSKRRNDDPLDGADATRARDPRADGGGPLKPGHRRPAGDHAPRRRTARLDDLRQARPSVDWDGIAPRSRRPALPARLTQPAGRETRENRPPKNKFPVFRYAVAAASVKPCSYAKRSSDEDACDAGRAGQASRARAARRPASDGAEQPRLEDGPLGA